MSDINPYIDNPNIIPPAIKTNFWVPPVFSLHFLHPVTCVASVFMFSFL